MHGGVILFRGSGADARRYVESDRSRADDYYLGTDEAVAQFTAIGGAGNTTATFALTPEKYARWVDWTDPLSGKSMGAPRQPGLGKRGSPRFAEMVVNAPKSLSIAAALHPEVSDALDAAQRDAVATIQHWLGQHSVTRVGPRGRQEVVPAEQVQAVAISHRTSRAGDPHRHIHFQIGTRVWAAGGWRGLDTAALFRQQGAIRALGTAVIAAHPSLAEALNRNGLTLDPVTGEVSELERFNAVMSKRAEQVGRNLQRLEAEWESAHPGQPMGPVISARLAAKAWAFERPAKKPTTLHEEHAWVAELREAGYDSTTLQHPTVHHAAVSLDDLLMQTVANRALDRCAAGASAWSRHTVQEQVTRIMTESGVQAEPKAVREFVDIATQLALEDCFSILPEDAPTPEHVAHLTTLRVIQAETLLHDVISARVPDHEPTYSDLRTRPLGLDAEQARAAAAVASSDPLVIVEGAAGSGKTTMLGAAIKNARHDGRASRLVAPTRKAAQAAQKELGILATSVAALVYANGWRWNDDGVWNRLTPGDIDPDTGATYQGPSADARLAPGERVIVDEAGMLDQDTAIALFTVCDTAAATVALVGDRAQLPAVGRGGVLDMAAHIRGRTFDMAEVHRFADRAYAAVTMRMRDGTNPGDVFDQLNETGLIRLHDSDEDARDAIAAEWREGEAITAATNDDARTLNDRIREVRVVRGLVDDTRVVFGNDGLSIGAGDLIQTRHNNSELGVANRQTWTVQHVEADGSLRVREARAGRKRQRTVHLPAEYVTEHTHLSYATTAYGIQGATVTGAHTLLTDTTTAAGVYVGMTRGRASNVLHIAAEDIADARAQFIDAMGRDRADRGLDVASAHAREDVAGLIENGPVTFINNQIETLLRRAEVAEARAALWQQADTALTELTAQETQKRAQAASRGRQTRHAVERVRAEIVVPILADAKAAVAQWRDANAHEQATLQKIADASWLRKRRARTEHENARSHVRDVRERLTRAWGGVPKPTERPTAWVERVTTPVINADPRLAEAEATHQSARNALYNRPERVRAARLAVYVRVFGAEKVMRDQFAFLKANPAQRCADLSQTAGRTRKEADLLRTLAPAEALERIRRAHAAEEEREARRTARQQTTQEEFQRQRHTVRGRPTRGL